MGGDRQAEDAHEKTTNIVSELFTGGFGALGNLAGKASEAMMKRITNDRGKDSYRYEYETCTSNGPGQGLDFSDPDVKLEGTGDGKWMSNHVEAASKHAK